MRVKEIIAYMGEDSGTSVFIVTNDFEFNSLLLFEESDLTAFADFAIELEHLKQVLVWRTSDHEQ